MLVHLWISVCHTSFRPQLSHQSIRHRAPDTSRGVSLQSAVAHPRTPSATHSMGTASHRVTSQIDLVGVNDFTRNSDLLQYRSATRPSARVRSTSATLCNTRLSNRPSSNAATA